MVDREPDDQGDDDRREVIEPSYGAGESVGDHQPENPG